MANTIKVRRGTAAELAAMGALESGEFGKTTDAHQVFVGDGTANHEVVMHDEFSAQSILAAVTDNTPAALTVAEQTLVGRITAGNIDDLSATQVRTLLNVADGATAGDSAAIHDNVAGEIVAVTEKTATVGDDEVLIEDSADTNAKKSAKLKNLAATRIIEYRILDKDTAHTVVAGVGGEFRVPLAMKVLDVGAYVDTAGVTGTATIDINEAGTTILSTKVTIDTTEKTSVTAAAAPVISDSAIGADAIITFDIDVIQTTAAKGLTVWMKVVF